jgi:hypothetical protein
VASLSFEATELSIGSLFGSFHHLLRKYFTASDMTKGHRHFSFLISFSEATEMPDGSPLGS